MHYLILFLLFSSISCNAKINEKSLLGSWTVIQDESKYPKTGIIDKLTFYPNDSLRIELFIDGKLNQSFSGTYQIDNKRNTIITRVNSAKVISEIIFLSDKRLILKDYNSKTITNYKRL